MKNRTFIQKYWYYFVIFTVFIGISITYDYCISHVEHKKFIAKLIFLKKPPVDAVPGGYWSPDGTWNNIPYVEKPKITHHHKTESKDTHDTVSDEKLKEIQRLTPIESKQRQTESKQRQIELNRRRISHLKTEIERNKTKIADKEAMLEHLYPQILENERAMEEQREFLKLIQKYNQPILVYEDYDFLFSYPTQSEILEKCQSKESLQAFCHRVKKFQSMLLEVSGEIDKRPAFARRMHRDYPDIMKKLKKLAELELPLISAEGMK